MACDKLAASLALPTHPTHGRNPAADRGHAAKKRDEREVAEDRHGHRAPVVRDRRLRRLAGVQVMVLKTPRRMCETVQHKGNQNGITDSSKYRYVYETLQKVETCFF